MQRWLVVAVASGIAGWLSGCSALVSLGGLSGAACGSACSDAGDAVTGTTSGSSSGSGSGISSSGGSSATFSDSGGDDDSASADDSGSSDDSASANDSGCNSGEDSGSANDGGSDSGPVATFGPTCPTGTVYADPFTTNPVASGTFESLVGPWTYNSASDTLSLGTGSPNTQLWIGPRPSWTNYTISLQVRLDTADANAGINFRIASTPIPPPNNSGQMYFAGLTATLAQIGIQNSVFTLLASQTGTFVQGEFYALEVTANGSSLALSIEGMPYLVSAEDSTFSFGSIGLRSYNSGATYGAITVTCE